MADIEAEIDTDEAVELLRGMVDTKSPTGGEEPLAGFLAKWAEDRGLRSRVQPIGTGRANVIISRPGVGGGPTLLFNGHLDTSYTGDEEHLKGIGYKAQTVIRDGWLFGLGAVNMKSGLAAALMALRTIARQNEQLPGAIIVAGVSGEIEKACIDEFQGAAYTGYGFGTARLIAHGVCADYGIVCEPTNFKQSHGNLGVLWVKVKLYGDMRHSTFYNEEADDHAIYNATRIIEAIRQWGRVYRKKHAYEGQPASVHVGAIQGGWPWRISRTPFSCTMYVDIRTNPKQRSEDVLREFTEVVHGALTGSQFGTHVEIDPYVIVPSVAAHGDEPVFKAVAAAHQAVFGRVPELEFRGPMADSIHLNAAGIPTVTYGLGPGGNFDAINPATGERGEQIRIEEYLKLIGIFIDAARRICGGKVQHA
jgi:acetylornithine deacetylase